MATVMSTDAFASVPPRSVRSDMAGPDTPLIRDCWYMAAWASEIGRTLLSRRILGTQVVLYRTEAGHVVALHDRCPHRSLPLSKGCLDGDAIRCGYPGLLFDMAGACIDAPPVDKPPRAMRIASYPLVERGPLVWIWLGDGAADEARIPDIWWLDDPSWVYGAGQMTSESNYVALQENLLDLSHFTFLHPGNVGTPEYASAPYTVSTHGEVVRVERFVANCPVPSIYKSIGVGEKRISRKTTSEYLTPGLHAAVAELTDLSPDADAREMFAARITHFVTPRDQGGTDYFFTIARDFALEGAQVTEAMRANALQAFLEDADALEAITRIQTDEPGFVEMSMKSDQAGVIMRRRLLQMAEAEGA